MNESIAKKYAALAHRMQYAQFHVGVEHNRIIRGPDLAAYFNKHGTVKGAVPRMYDATQSIVDFLIAEKIEDVTRLTRENIAEKMRQYSRSDPAKTA